VERSGFFNSSGGDRVYNATDFARYFGCLASNGIFWATASNLRVTPGTGVNVSVAPGAAWINGYHYENTSPLEKTLETPDGVNPRIDRVVLRLSIPERRIFAAVKTGAPAAIPEPPELTRTSDVYELALADVTVPRAAVSLVTGNVADQRLNQSLCGLVNSLVSAVYE
jgi:hypothetical protein